MMTESNLSRVWAPNVMRSGRATVDDTELQFMQNANNVFHIMITHAAALFKVSIAFRIIPKLKFHSLK